MHADANAAEIAARKKLIREAIPEDGFEAERIAKAQWGEWKKSLPASAHVPKTEGPANKFWNRHYYAALRSVLKKQRFLVQDVKQEESVAPIIPAAASENVFITTALQASSPGSARKSDPTEVGNASFKTLMSGRGFCVISASVQEIVSVRSGMIFEDKEIGAYVNFEGMLLHCDEEAGSLTRRDSEPSPKKQRGAFQIVDIVLLDGTGLALFSFAGSGGGSILTFFSTVFRGTESYFFDESAYRRTSSERLEW